MRGIMADAKAYTGAERQEEEGEVEDMDRNSS